MNLVLLGLRGAGKSSVGPALAETLLRPFVDLDIITARAAGLPSAGEALATLGEARFREAEAGALRVVLAGDQHVVALGGGTPTYAPSARLLSDARVARRARTIYLRARPDTLAVRLRDSDLAARPSLTGAGTLAEIDALFAVRDPLYLALADVVIDVDGLSQADVVARCAGAPHA
ncbi:MAG: shikimate kinase [Planctomycetota bacterium]|nr:shikimate kinase [Planctomycetota bacterium]